MKIGLYELKHLVAQIINEGAAADDLKVLQLRYPNEADALSRSPFIVNGQPTKWFKWLQSRFLPDPPKEEFPLDHAIDSVQRYVQKEQALQTAFGQPDFIEALKTAFPSGFNLNDFNNVEKLTVDKLDKTLKVFYEYDEKKKDRLGIDYDAIDIEGDKLGKIGPWSIWMPTSRETSCTIVRVKDPATGQMRPSPCDWCTIRTKGSNLFYGYTARVDENIILYYLIRDNPEIYNIKNKDYVSIGFINNKLVANSQRGGVTVDCNNDGLTEFDLKNIFKENYDSIINFLSQKTKEIGGNHPAKNKIKEATQSLEALNYFIKGIGQNEKAELSYEIIKFGQKSKNIKPDVEEKCWEYILKSKEEDFLLLVVEQLKCPQYVLEKLLDINSFDLKISIAQSNDCTLPVFEKLYKTNDTDIHAEIAQNLSCPLKIFEKLVIDSPYLIKYYVAGNHSCPPHILEDFINSGTSIGINDLKNKALENPNCPPHILENLSDIKERWTVRESISKNINCPPHILENLSNDPNDVIKQSVASNPNCLPETLKKLYITKHKDGDFDIKLGIASNTKCPPEILKKIVDDNVDKNFNQSLIYTAIMNLNNSLENLEKFSINKDPFVRSAAVRHPKILDSIVKKLCSDLNQNVKEQAMRVAQKRNLQLESLRKKISKLIYAVR